MALPDTLTNSYTPDGLVVSDWPTNTDAETLVSGQNLSRGCVVGKITASSKLTACDHTASDGSETPFGVLAADCDASAADASCVIYDFGKFNSDKLTFGGSSTISDLKAAMKAVNLYVKDAVD